MRHLVDARPPAILLLALALLSCQSESSAPKAKGPVATVDPATAGSIQVQVNYTGAASGPTPINMAGTPACAAMHPDPVVEQPISVSDGRLANAVVYIKSGFGDRSFTPPSQPAVIDQKGCLYDPRVVAVMVGQPLQFRNSDPEAHNVHGRPKELDGWNFLMSRPNSTRDLTFDKPEIGVLVSCDVHPWMRAYVSVLDNPYFGVTPSNGTVTLQQVPPGDYVVGVWHESLGTLVQPVKLPPSGNATAQFTFQQPEQ